MDKDILFEVALVYDFALDNHNFVLCLIGLSTLNSYVVGNVLFLKSNNLKFLILWFGWVVETGYLLCQMAYIKLLSSWSFWFQDLPGSVSIQNILLRYFL